MAYLSVDEMLKLLQALDDLSVKTGVSESVQVAGRQLLEGQMTRVLQVTT